ncbi:hypothetical protein OAN61_01115, partial [bacterium]|nr:hypothetical protein [bacterium]
RGEGGGRGTLEGLVARVLCEHGALRHAARELELLRAELLAARERFLALGREAQLTVSTSEASGEGASPEPELPRPAAKTAATASAPTVAAAAVPLSAYEMALFADRRGAGARYVRRLGRALSTAAQLDHLRHCERVFWQWMRSVVQQGCAGAPPPIGDSPQALSLRRLDAVRSWEAMQRERRALLQVLRDAQTAAPSPAAAPGAEQLEELRARVQRSLPNLSAVYARERDRMAASTRSGAGALRSLCLIDASTLHSVAAAGLSPRCAHGLCFHHARRT